MVGVCCRFVDDIVLVTTNSYYKDLTQDMSGIFFIYFCQLYMSYLKTTAPGGMSRTATANLPWLGVYLNSTAELRQGCFGCGDTTSLGILKYWKLKEKIF